MVEIKSILNILESIDLSKNKLSNKDLKKIKLVRKNIKETGNIKLMQIEKKYRPSIFMERSKFSLFLYIFLSIILIILIKRYSNVYLLTIFSLLWPIFSAIFIVKKKDNHDKFWHYRTALMDELKILKRKR